MESLLAQHSSISLSGCGLVSEYLQSGRREENSDHEARCSDRRSVEGQQKFQVSGRRIVLTVATGACVVSGGLLLRRNCYLSLGETSDLKTG